MSGAKSTTGNVYDQALYSAKYWDGPVRTDEPFSELSYENISAEWHCCAFAIIVIIIAHIIELMDLQR